MKKFDGIYKDQYSTLFGMFQIRCQYSVWLNRPVYVFKQITSTCLTPTVNTQFGIRERHFPNKTQALIWLRDRENNLLTEVKELLQECTK